RHGRRPGRRPGPDPVPGTVRRIPRPVRRTARRPDTRSARARSSPMRQLEGKIAVITGAGAGIGRATALALAGQRCTVAVCDLDEAAAKETVELVVAAGGRASSHQVDVAAEPQMRALVAAVLAEHGVVDIVINNAGIAGPTLPTAEIPLDRFRTVLDVNFWGVVHGSVLFLPHL